MTLLEKNIEKIPSPCYVMEEALLRRNLELIRSVAQRAEVEIILAFKAFALWKSFPIFREYIRHTTASSPGFITSAVTLPDFPKSIPGTGILTLYGSASDPSETTFSNTVKNGVITMCHPLSVRSSQAPVSTVRMSMLGDVLLITPEYII